jgi:flavodoxin
MSKILIIYTTVGGNTELVVEKVSNLLSKNNSVEAKLADLTEAKDLQSKDLVILASPTYNQGTLEAHFQKFISKLEKSDVEGKKFAVIGLGDTKYYPEYLTESATILENYVKKMEGKLIVPALRIGTLPYKMLDSLVPKWVEKLEGALN